MLEYRLEAALNSWRQWHIQITNKPILIKELTGGKTNRSFLVKAQSSETVSEILAVLRLNTPFSQQLGIDRQREKHILQKAAEAGLAPATYFNNLDILVTAYLPGNNLNNQTLSTSQQQNYHRLLQNIHKLTIAPSRFSYLTHTELYWRQLIASGIELPVKLKNHRNTMLKIIENFETANPERVLCHHDPGLHNLIEVDGVLKLIDWEYASPGIADIDFAFSGILKPANKEAAMISDYINELWTRVEGISRQPVHL